MFVSENSIPLAGATPKTEALIAGLVHHIPAMVAYWDINQRCLFANAAYLECFGRTPAQMQGISIGELLGPLYALNLPYISKALAGEKQVFERQILLPNGEVRESIATYTPHFEAGLVRGFYAHVADVSPVRRREDRLKQAITEAIQILERTKRSFRSSDLAQLRARLELLDRG